MTALAEVPWTILFIVQYIVVIVVAVAEEEADDWDVGLEVSVSRCALFGFASNMMMVKE